MPPFSTLRPPSPDEIDWVNPVNTESPQAIGLVAWYPFWLYGCPNAQVCSAHGRNWVGQRYNMTKGGTFNFVTYPYSWFGAVPDFDGSSDYFVYNGVIVQRPCTIAAWFSKDVLPSSTNQTIFGSSKHASVDPYFHLWIGNSGDYYNKLVMLEKAGGILSYAASATTLNANTWYHGVGVLASASSRRVYLNGVKSSDSTYIGDYSGLTMSEIGAITVSGGRVTFWDGKIAEVRLYNRALSDSEVYALWHPNSRFDLVRRLPKRRVYPSAVVTATSPSWAIAY